MEQKKVSVVINKFLKKANSTIGDYIKMQNLKGLYSSIHGTLEEPIFLQLPMNEKIANLINTTLDYIAQFDPSYQNLLDSKHLWGTVINQIIEWSPAKMAK